MKRLTLLLTLLVSGLILNAQTHTVENFNVEPEGEQLKITYRIGASTQTQLFKVTLSCSMDGSPRFEPKSVIGDVGNNVVGGKSIYTIMWDVFEDVDEVVNPNITVKVDLMNGDTPPPVTRNTQQPVQQPIQEDKKQEEPQRMQEPVYEPAKEQASYTPEFERNGYFAFTSGFTGFPFPVGISFGSLNKWGYYVTPIRFALERYDYWDPYYGEYDPDFDFEYMFSAGASRNIVGKGLFRLHGFAGAGGHVIGYHMATDPRAESHFLIETGVQGVIGGFYISGGIEVSLGYYTSFIWAMGFTF